MRNTFGGDWRDGESFETEFNEWISIKVLGRGGANVTW